MIGTRTGTNLHSDLHGMRIPILITLNYHTTSCMTADYTVCYCRDGSDPWVRPISYLIRTWVGPMLSHRTRGSDLWVMGNGSGPFLRDGQSVGSFFVRWVVGRGLF